MRLIQYCSVCTDKHFAAKKTVAKGKPGNEEGEINAEVGIIICILCNQLYMILYAKEYNASYSEFLAKTEPC